MNKTGVFSVNRKIYYYDTDCGGVVYYGNYLKFLEEARTEFLANKGVSVNELTKQGVWFVVSRQELDYRHPAYYADILTIETKLNRISAVRMEFEYELKNQSGVILSFAKTTLVCVNKNFKPRAIPEDVRGRFIV